MLMTPGQQHAHLAGMAKDINQTFRRENYSRVAQAREMRRMAHARELAMLKAREERKRAKEMERASRPDPRLPNGMLPPPPPPPHPGLEPYGNAVRQLVGGGFR
jgi:hypothetical protein